MPPQNQQIERILHRLALVLAAVVATAIPLGFVLNEYHDYSKSLAFKARVKATALSRLIASSPDVWMYAENHLQGLISREPVPLSDELVQVLDKDDSVITQTGKTPAGPQLRRSAPLYDGSHVVGQLVVQGALQRLALNAGLVALVGLLLGAMVYFVMKVLPLKALRAASAELLAEKERAETPLQSIGDAVITTDAFGAINYLNPVAEKLLGFAQHEAIGRHISDIIHLTDVNDDVVESSLHQALKTKMTISCQGNSELLRPDGTKVAIEERASPINGTDGEVTGGVVVLRDVSVAREYVQRRSWEATHDPLTGLFNRREFESRVQAALADTQKTGADHVVCYMDLDHFKIVNDSSGHAAGDELLTQITQLIQAHIRETDTLARLGGDEFGLLLEECEARRAQLIASEIIAAVNGFNFAWGAKAFTVGISIGMTAITAEHSRVAEVLGEADCACYWAKEQGSHRGCVYLASDMNLAARRSETGWVARINAAFKDKRFVLYHQTYRSLNSSDAHADHLEVLIRMIGEDGGIIAPGRFLPAAERYNLMPEIDRWVIHEVFSRYHYLVAERGGLPLTCAINLSGASINSEGFLEFIRKQAHTYKLSPGAICFELTETVAVNNLQAAAEFIRECKAIGFQFALDDFGTGTSSFGYLKNLPVDYLKIDGSFVQTIEHDKVDQAMVETINHIGHLLGKRTVAEYAENDAIIEMLKAIHVDYAQGYGVCPPKPLFSDVTVSGHLFHEPDTALRS